MSIPAIHKATTADLRRDLVPGSFTVTEPDPVTGEQRMTYVCPCGCGVWGNLRVGNGFKPAGRPASWNWNGSFDAPDLSPSVNHVGHWHGWLRNGQWVLA